MAAGNTLDTTGNPLTISAAAIDLSANHSALTATGSTVTLTSTAGTINEGGKGVITAATVTGSSTGGATLTGANLFDSLGGFTNTGVGNVSITDDKASGLTVAATVDAGAGNTLTLTTTSGGPLTLSAGLSANGGAVDLVSAGALAQTAGVITTGTLTGSSIGGATLTGANLFAILSGFANTGTGNVSIADAEGTGLTVVGSVNAGPGNSLALANSAGALSQTAGTLTTGRDLTLSALTALALSATPLLPRDYTVTAATFGSHTLTALPGRDFTINSLASFALTAPLTAPRNLTVTSTGALDTSAVTLTATGGTLTLQGATGLTVGATTATSGATSFVTTTSGNISLQGAVDAAGQTLTLTSLGTISQGVAGIITASTVTGSSVGGATLTEANLFANLGAFTNTGAGDLSITDAKASGLTINAAVGIGTGTLTLTSSGAIDQTAGTITAGTLTGSSVGGARFTQANLFDNLAGYTNTGDGQCLSITDAKASDGLADRIRRPGRDRNRDPDPDLVGRDQPDGGDDNRLLGTPDRLIGWRRAACAGDPLRQPGRLHQLRDRKRLDHRRPGHGPDGDRGGGRGLG